MTWTEDDWRAFEALAEPQRAAIVDARGAPIWQAPCGATWYRIADRVYCAMSATQCQYCGQADLWSPPMRGRPYKAPIHGPKPRTRRMRDRREP